MLALRRPGDRYPGSLTGDTLPRSMNWNEHDRRLIKFLHAVMYPFHVADISPTFETHQVPSRKYKIYERGTFGTSVGGTADGWGFVACTPSAARDGNVITTGTLTLPANGFQNSVTTAGGTGPYSSGDFGSSRLSRVLCCALRVRNITPALNRGGTLHALKSPIDVALPTGSTNDFNGQISNLTTSGNVRRCDTSGGQWQYLGWVPHDSEQEEFTQSSSPISFGGTYISRNLAFVAFSTTVAPQTYEWEYVSWAECIELNSSVITATVQGSTLNETHPDTSRALQYAHHHVGTPAHANNEPHPGIASYILSAVKTGEEIATAIDKTAALAERAIAAAPGLVNTASRLARLAGI